MRRKIGIVILFCILLCTGCRDGSTEIDKQEQPVELVFSWWGNDSRHEYTIKAVKEFEEKHPKIRVTLKYGSWNGYEDRFRMEMMSNTEADVMMINYPWLREYSPDGSRFYDIYLGRGDINLISFSEEAEKMGTINGKLNALPISLNTSVFYWNKTMLDRYGVSVPSAWDDLFDAAETMSGDDVYLLCAEPQFVWFMCVAYAEQESGREILGANGELQFTQEDIQTMLEFYHRLTEEKVLLPVDEFDKNDLLEQRCAGVVAWISSGDSCCGDAIENGYEMVVGDQLQMPGAKRNGWYYKPSAYYVVSANSAHPKEAVILMNFLLNSREMTLGQKLEKGVPVSSAARKLLDENDLLTGLPYDAFQKLDEALSNNEIEMESPYFEMQSLMKRFTALAQEAADSGRIKQQAEEFYQFMQEKAYLAR